MAHKLGEAAIDRKAAYPVLVDLRGRSAYTDFLLICSGTSDRHVQSVADSVMKAAKELGVTIVGSEGISEGQWALIDVGSVVVHVFHHFTRDVYALETLWPGAERTVLEEAPATANA
ncbi:MAG: ribosome silencing factor [Myxococcota bacterium]